MAHLWKHTCTANVDPAEPIFSPLAGEDGSVTAPLGFNMKSSTKGALDLPEMPDIESACTGKGGTTEFTTPLTLVPVVGPVPDTALPHVPARCLV